jgi:hypothetical protein
MHLSIFNRARSLGVAVAMAVIASLSAGLASAQSCPDLNLFGSPIEPLPTDLTSPLEVVGTAGGPLNLADCPDVPGTGLITAAPNYEMTMVGYTQKPMDLMLSVFSDCDTVLLINDTQGSWVFNDDEDGGMNPRIVVPLTADGTIDIWLGTYDAKSCPATLQFQTFLPGTAPPTTSSSLLTCPDFNLEAPLLSYGIGQLATPQSTQVIAGGDLDLSACPDGLGVGYIIASPDFQMDLSGNTAGQDVEIRVNALCDATLLVNDASGQWIFNDDTEGTNPVVVLPAAMDGSYDIWVGTLGPDNCDATLDISASTGKGAQEQPPVLNTSPDPGDLTGYRGQIGVVLDFTVTGSTDGRVYGTDEYTDDSDLSTAAVHAGFIAPGETGVVTVQIVGPGKGYEASTAFGVTSYSYGKWDGGFIFVQY